MTRNEFKQWSNDFAMRFPTTGEWLLSLKRQTIDVWFTEVFATLELRDCLMVNRMLMKDPSKLEAYNRERLPSVFVRGCAELRHITPPVEEPKIVLILPGGRRSLWSDNRGFPLKDPRLPRGGEVPADEDRNPIWEDENGKPNYKAIRC